MKSSMEYLTVRARNFDKFDEDVNKKLKEGFLLYGNPYVTDGDDEFYVCQAMTKEPKVKVGAFLSA